MKISEKITILRKARGLSQEQLGLSLSTKDNGVSRQTVSEWENGKSEPKLDNIRALANLLSVSYDSLLDESIDLNNSKELYSVLEGDNKDSKSSKFYIYQKKQPIYIHIICFVALAALVFLTLFLFHNANVYMKQAQEIGISTIKGMNLVNRAKTFSAPATICAVLISVPIVTSLVFAIHGAFTAKYVGYVDDTELVYFPSGDTKQKNARKISLNEIENFKKEKFNSVVLKLKEETITFHFLTDQIGLLREIELRKCKNVK